MEAVRQKFTSELRDMLNDIDIVPLCRLDPNRLKSRALPHIGSIELVTGQNFSQYYDDLYLSMFKPGERERSDLIVERLNQDFAGQRIGLQPYRIVGIRDHQGLAIGAAQISVLLPKQSSLAVPYIQYIYVRSGNRRQDMADVLHTMVLAVATADVASLGRTVPYTLFETEPPNYGPDETSRAISTQRVQIHTRAGAEALMLRREEDEQLISAHVQPGLEVDDPPYSIVWAIRKSPACNSIPDIQSTSSGVIAAYYQSLRDEGFPEKNIKLAEEIVARRSSGCDFVLVPLDQAVTQLASRD